MNGINSLKQPVPGSLQGWLGLVLLAVCWPLNWTLPGMRTAYLFFPLCLGYILMVDACLLYTSFMSKLKHEPGAPANPGPVSVPGH